MWRKGAWGEPSAVWNSTSETPPSSSCAFNRKAVAPDCTNSVTSSATLFSEGLITVATAVRSFVVSASKGIAIFLGELRTWWRWEISAFPLMCAIWHFVLGVCVSFAVPCCFRWDRCVGTHCMNQQYARFCSKSRQIRKKNITHFILWMLKISSAL